MGQPNIAPAAPQQRFEKAPTSDVSDEVLSDSDGQASCVSAPTVIGSNDDPQSYDWESSTNRDRIIMDRRHDKLTAVVVILALVVLVISISAANMSSSA